MSVFVSEDDTCSRFSIRFVGSFEIYDVKCFVHFVIYSFFLYEKKISNRLSPLNMPDYAEVAGCSTFKNTTTSPLYDSYGAYATTNVVRNTNTFAAGSNFPHGNKKSSNSLYSAPTICHFNTNDGHNLVHSDANFASANKIASNIIENKIDVINNLNRSSSTTNGSAAATMSGMASVPSTPIIGVGTMRRNRLPKLGHCDKISFGGCDNGRNIDQPLFIKSKEDGSWTSVQNSAYHFSAATSAMTKSGGGVGGNSVGNDNGSGDSKYRKNGSNSNCSSNQNSVNNNGANSASSQIYLSSFGKADNV